MLVLIWESWLTLPKIELEDLNLIWREWTLWQFSFPAFIEQRQYNYLPQYISRDIPKDWAWGPWPQLKRVNALKSLFSGFHRTETIQLFTSIYFKGHSQRLSLRTLTSIEESESFDISLFWLSSNKDNTIIYLNIFHGTLPKIEFEGLDLIWREWVLWQFSFLAFIEQRQYNFLPQYISWLKETRKWPKIEFEGLDLIWREWTLWHFSFPASIEQRRYNYLPQYISWHITKDWAWGPWPHLKRVICLFDLILYVHSTIFQLCGTVFLGWTSTKLG